MDLTIGKYVYFTIKYIIRIIYISKPFIPVLDDVVDQNAPLFLVCIYLNRSKRYDYHLYLEDKSYLFLMSKMLIHTGCFKHIYIIMKLIEVFSQRITFDHFTLKLRIFIQGEKTTCQIGELSMFNRSTVSVNECILP